MEKRINENVTLGKGPFVSAFANANEGDASPNISGPRCIDSGLPCDEITSTCGRKSENCVANGPGTDIFESMEIIGKRQVKDDVQFIHQFIEITSVTVELPNGKIGKTCKSAMGYSFAAGTIDGSGQFNFQQSTTRSTFYWNFLRNLIFKRPSQEMIECHKPKPILIPTGEMSRPFHWQPSIVPTQMFRIGDVFIAAISGEMTTMAGRRLRAALKQILQTNHVICAALANDYSSYITTFEEYQTQRYEGTSTAYGPHTLTAYIQQFVKLAKAMLNGTTLNAGPQPAYRKPLKPQSQFAFDIAEYNFGTCVQNANTSYALGSIVKVKFAAGNPANYLMTQKTFL
ncbi:neutral ceramidase-like protein, partial [Dinothrombium tinctorium]